MSKRMAKIQDRPDTLFMGVFLDNCLLDPVTAVYHRSQYLKILAEDIFLVCYKPVIIDIIADQPMLDDLAHARQVLPAA